MRELKTPNGIFLNNEKTGQSAEEVYQEWLENKNKPPIPSVEERTAMLEDTINFLLGL